ncbi:hypothetical protein ACEW7V_02775 [Areca yellow leaf disease phytoplasma]
MIAGTGNVQRKDEALNIQKCLQVPDQTQVQTLIFQLTLLIP